MKFWSNNLMFLLKCHEKKLFPNVVCYYLKINAGKEFLKLVIFHWKIMWTWNQWKAKHLTFITPYVFADNFRDIFNSFLVRRTMQRTKKWSKLVWDLLTWPQSGNSGWSGLSIEPGCLSKGNDGTIDSIHRKSITFNSQNLVHHGVNLH